MPEPRFVPAFPVRLLHIRDLHDAAPALRVAWLELQSKMPANKVCSGVVVQKQKGNVMPKFLIKASYTQAGAKGLLHEGGSSRKAAVEKMVSALGGKLEAFYFAFGETDVYGICELPDAVTAAAASLAINSSGMVSETIVPLLTPEEIDKACKKSVAYRAPGA